MISINHPKACKSMIRFLYGEGSPNGCLRKNVRKEAANFLSGKLRRLRSSIIEHTVSVI